MNRARAENMHKANPHIWASFERISLGAIASGVQRWSARAIWEIMRWEALQRGVSGEVFKLANDYHPFYARLFAETYPDHAGFFVFRTSQFDAGGPDHPQVDMFDPGSE